MRVYFAHGLGDCTYFAHQLPLYVRRGHQIELVCKSEERILFEGSGVTILHERNGDPMVAWVEAPGFERLQPDSLWQVNKAAVNIGLDPMPFLGPPQDLWDEFCNVRIDLRPFIAREEWIAVRKFLAPLPRPVVLLHTKGNTAQEGKSVRDELAIDLYRHLLDRTAGSLVLLDWDNRVPRLASYRVRHLNDDWERISVPRLLALFHEADLVVGIDSGPLHAVRFTDTPSVGMFPTAAHYPARWCLPRGRQVNLVPRDLTHEWNKRARIPYNIVECAGSEIEPCAVADASARMLAGPRYLSAEHLGADVQMQQFVLDWERGSSNELSEYIDRDNSYDLLFKEIKRRFNRPRIVETGCIRSEEDWRGAGFSTYLFASVRSRFGGRLISVDNDPGQCAFARDWTKSFGCVDVVCSDSSEYLAQLKEPIDVLQLDSWDFYVPGYAEHSLREIQAAEPLLHSRSLVIFDDTVYRAREFRGKGEQAVPWMLERGWRILYSSYQTILERV